MTVVVDSIVGIFSFSALFKLADNIDVFYGPAMHHNRDMF